MTGVDSAMRGLVVDETTYPLTTVLRYWSPCRCADGRHVRATRGTPTVVRARALDDLRPGEHLVHWCRALSAVEEVPA